MSQSWTQNKIYTVYKQRPEFNFDTKFEVPNEYRWCPNFTEMKFETPPFQRDQKRQIPTSDAIVVAFRSGAQKLEKYRGDIFFFSRAAPWVQPEKERKKIVKFCSQICLPPLRDAATIASEVGIRRFWSRWKGGVSNSISGKFGQHRSSFVFRISCRSWTLVAVGKQCESCSGSNFETSLPFLLNSESINSFCILK